MTAAPAPGCTVDAFRIRLIDERNPKVAVGQSVDFYVYFPTITDSSSHIVFNSHIGSVNIQYGDGTGDDTGLQTFDPPNAWGGFGANRRFTHVYKRPGTFTASVKGGGTQPCAIKPGLAPITVNVPATYQAVANDKVAAHALIPGKIEKAGMVAGPGTAWNVQIEGSGKCSLKMFEELGGVSLQQYDYNGPLPTKIWIRPTESYVDTQFNFTGQRIAYGTHVLKIEGNKSPDGCAGTASVSWTVQSLGRAKKK